MPDETLAEIIGAMIRANPKPARGLALSSMLISAGCAGAILLNDRFHWGWPWADRALGLSAAVFLISAVFLAGIMIVLWVEK